MVYALQTAKKVRIFGVRYEEEEIFLGKVVRSYDDINEFVKKSDAEKYLSIQGYKDMENTTGSLKTTATIIPKIIYRYE